MKKWWFGEKKHIDAEKAALRKNAKLVVREFIENRDEDAYVQYVKGLNPDLSPQDLIRHIEFFREQCEQVRR